MHQLLSNCKGFFFTLIMVITWFIAVSVMLLSILDPGGITIHWILSNIVELL